MNEVQPTRATGRWAVGLGVVLFASALLAVGLWLLRASPPTQPEAESADFLLPSLDGEQLGPSSYAGKVVVIDFWATWCAPCRVQAEILEQIHSEYSGKGVEFLAVSLGEDESTVRSFVEKEPFAYPVLFDPEDRVSAQLGIYALPTVMIVDRDGAVAYRHAGISSEATVRTLLSQAGAG